MAIGFSRKTKNNLLNQDKNDSICMQRAENASSVGCAMECLYLGNSAVTPFGSLEKER